MIPGMSRRMAEHREGLLTEAELHRGADVPLLKPGNGSFGHHVLSTDETLYSLESTRGPMVTSQSINSVVGITSQHVTSGRNIQECAEVVPVTADVERRSPMAATMSRLQQQQQMHHQSFLYNNSPTLHSTTLPRQVEKRNNHHHQQQQQHHQYSQQQGYHHQPHAGPPIPRHFVVATNGLSDDIEMDRTSFMNGDDEDDENDVKDTSQCRPPMQQQPHQGPIL